MGDNTAVRFASVVLIHGLAVGCKYKVDDYCSETVICEDAEKPFCDLNGEYEASGFVTNTCIPCPFVDRPPETCAASFDAGPDAPPDAAAEPMVTQLTANDGQANDNFGIVAISGDTVAVGAPGDDDAAQDSGAVYIFEWSASSGEWQQVVKLKADDPIAGNRFGSAVDLAGDTLVVGAPGTGVDAGVYVFEKNLSGSWLLTPKLTSGAANDSFGQEVATNGTYVVVGAPGDDQLAAQAGAVFVFERGVSNWTLDQKLTASDAVSGDALGAAVTISGGRIAAGATGVDSPVENAGAAYIWELDTGWQPKPRISYTGATFGETQFAGAVAMDGDVLMIGAKNDDALANEAGVVFYYLRNAGGAWELAATLTASDGSASDRFGESVALQDTSLVVGAPYKQSNTGAAYRFQFAAAWDEAELITTDMTAAGDYFGSPVDVDGDRAVVGSVWDASGVGSAYVVTW